MVNFIKSIFVTVKGFLLKPNLKDILIKSTDNEDIPFVPIIQKDFEKKKIGDPVRVKIQIKPPSAKPNNYLKKNLYLKMEEIYRDLYGYRVVMGPSCKTVDLTQYFI